MTNRDPTDPNWPDTYARAALENITREYPNAPALKLRGPEDLREPREVHPAFYGSFDWHSSVHMHWSLIRLLRTHPEVSCAEEARECLRAHLSHDSLAREAEYLRSFPLFERPYGWGWALALIAEAPAWREGHGVLELEALDELGDVIAELLQRYLKASHYPNRAGTHGNSAFALVLALHHARVGGRAELVDAIRGTALHWYGNDRDAPIGYEPSGEDFLSPALCEAHLMGLVLPSEEFDPWLRRFLPGLQEAVPAPLDEVPIVGDHIDGRIGHLLGLSLSRAWNWRAIAGALPEDDPRRATALEAADRQAEVGLEKVLMGNYESDHWLVSFALLAMQGLGGNA
jgi:hypothetical protein